MVAIVVAGVVATSSVAIARRCCGMSSVRRILHETMLLARRLEVICATTRRASTTSRGGSYDVRLFLCSRVLCTGGSQEKDSPMVDGRLRDRGVRVSTALTSGRERCTTRLERTHILEQKTSNFVRSS
jgi:hypothetical protein